MVTQVGTIEALYRYPVKSMRGEALDEAPLGWHGLDGDRRFAVRRVGARGGMPWLTASRLPELVRFVPCGGDARGERLPTHARTPEGDELELLGAELAADLGRRHGAAVEVLQLGHGIFDETNVSVIATATVAELCRLGGVRDDARRFRPNVVVRWPGAAPFDDDAWVGGVLTFGDDADAPAVTVTMRDVRCAMVNIDPDTAALAPDVMKAVVRVHDTTAGVYATVTRPGRLAVGAPVFLHR